MKACDAVQELLAAHLLEALGESEEALVQAHLEDCPRCRGVKSDTRSCLKRVHAPPLAPPPAAWSRLRSRIDREHGADPVRDHEPDLVISLSCSFCRGGLVRDDAVYCASCLAPHHPVCFSEHGRCSVMGCHETRIVRPSEPPTLKVKPGGRVGSRRGRWLWGGLVLAATGALGSAALVELESSPGLGQDPGARLARATPQVVPPPRIVIEREPDPPQVTAPEPGPLESSGVEAPEEPDPSHEASGGAKRVRLQAEQVSLKELVTALSQATGAAIELSRDAKLGRLLVREARWGGTPWPEALGALCEGLDLVLVEPDAGDPRWRVVAAPAFDPSRHEVAEAELPVDRTELVRLSDEPPQELLRSWGQRVVAAARGDAFAIVEESRLDLHRDARRVKSRRFAGELGDLAWSWDGRRLAFLVLRADGASLELFELDEFGLFQLRRLRELSGVDGRARLAWLGRGDDLLLNTGKDLRWVSSLRGEAHTLQTPRPDGQAAFEVLPWDEERFCVRTSERLSVWRLSPVQRHLYDLPLLIGSRVSLAPERGLALVVTDTHVDLQALGEGRFGSALRITSREELEGAWGADLAPTGQHIAHLEGTSLYVHRADRTRGPILAGEGVEGFRWNPQGERLASWGSRGCQVLEFAGAPPSAPRRRTLRPIGTGRLLDLQWLGNGALTLTTRVQERRVPSAAVDLLTREPERD